MMRFFAVFLIILLTACAHTSESQKNHPLESLLRSGSNLMQPDHTSELLAFYDVFSDANIESQKNLLTELSKPITDRQQNLLRQIKLTMVLGLPSSRVRDTVKSQLLLQELIQSGHLTIPDSAFVNLLYEFMTDTNKLAKAKGDNKSQQQRIDALQQKNDQLQQKYDALEQKLDALKKIEKTMGDRDAATPAKP